MLEDIWWVSTWLRKWLIPIGKYSYRDIRRVASDCWWVKKWQCFSGCHGVGVTGCLPLLSQLWMVPCPQDGLGREKPEGQGRKMDRECNSFPRAGIDLSAYNALKWQWVLVEWNLETPTPYLLCVSDRCVEGMCSLVSLDIIYKVFSPAKKSSDIFEMTGCIFLSYLISIILTFL